MGNQNLFCLIYNLTVGIYGLYDSKTGGISSACSADYLSQQRKGALIASVILAVHSAVCTQHAHDRNIREIESLCDHLSTQQNIVLPL